MMERVEIDRHGVWRLNEDVVRALVGQEPNWGFGALGYVVFKRTYAWDRALLPERYGVGATGQETWLECCVRVVEGAMGTLRAHTLSRGGEWLEDKAQVTGREMLRRMFAFKWLPPGRGLRMMGVPFTWRRSGAPLNNCAFTSTAHIADDIAAPFVWSFGMLMMGTGVGFDTRGAGAVRLVEPERRGTHVIEDSREGWAGAFATLLRAFTGHGALPLAWDASRIRPKGELIASFGGRASGPQPLLTALDRLERLCERYTGKLVDSAWIVDVMNITGACVVSGGIRRSAEIAFGAAEDESFARLKQLDDGAEEWAWRWASNNSIFADLGMNYGFHAQLSATNGEPGYAWLENMRAYGRMGDEATWADERVMGGNPCVTADTIVMTAQGPRRVSALIGVPFNAFVDGAAHACRTGFFATGTKPVYELVTEEGLRLRVTENHQILHVPKLTEKKRYETWVEAKDLSPGDMIVVNNARELPEWEGMGTFGEGWLLGSMLGDGHVHFSGDEGTCKLQYWGESKREMLALALERIAGLGGDPRYHAMRTGTELPDRDMVSTGSRKLYALMREFGIDDEKNITSDALLLSSSAFHRGFLRGLFDADGSVQGHQGKGVSVRLRSTRRQHLHVAQQMLLHLGIHSKVYEDRQPAGYNTLPDGNGGVAEYWCEAIHGLIISKDNLVTYHERVGFDEPAKSERLAALLDAYVRRPNRERFVCRVKSLEYAGIEPVYDCTVDTIHRFAANNLVIHNCLEQSLEDGELCCLVETFPAHHGSTVDWLTTLKVAYLYAKAVTLYPTHSARTNAIITANRRIGCSVSGVIQAQQRFGRERLERMLARGYDYIAHLDATYARWLHVPRSIKTTSVKPSGTVSLLAGATPGCHWDHGAKYIRRMRLADTSPLIAPLRAAGYPIEPDTYAADTLVVEFPVRTGTTRGKADVPLREKVELAAMLQRVWADNQVSCTADFAPEEAGQIRPLLDEFQSQLKGISFLKRSGHGYAQAPYESITSEEYDRRASALRPLDLSAAEHEADDLFCDGASCEIR